MRYVLTMAAMLLLAPAALAQTTTDPVPSIAATQVALDAYAADPLTHQFPREVLSGARVLEAGPCRGSVCQVRVALAAGGQQLIRVQFDRRQSNLAVDNVAIPVN